MTDAEYEAKFLEMQKHIPFIRKVIAKLKVNNDDQGDNPRQAQLQKMEMLYDLLTNRAKKLKMETLIKCEQVLIKLHAKIEKNDDEPSTSAGCKPIEATEIKASTSAGCKPIEATETKASTSNFATTSTQKSSAASVKTESSKSSVTFTSAPASPSPENTVEPEEPRLIPTERRDSPFEVIDKEKRSRSKEEITTKKDYNKHRHHHGSGGGHHEAQRQHQHRPFYAGQQQSHFHSKYSSRSSEETHRFQGSSSSSREELPHHSKRSVSPKPHHSSFGSKSYNTSQQISPISTLQRTSSNDVFRDSFSKNQSTSQKKDFATMSSLPPRSSTPQNIQTVKVVITEPLPANIAKQHFPPQHQYRYQQQSIQNQSPTARDSQRFLHNIETLPQSGSAISPCLAMLANDAYNPAEPWESLNDNYRNIKIKTTSSMTEPKTKPIFSRLGDKVVDEEEPTPAPAPALFAAFPRSTSTSVPVPVPVPISVRINNNSMPEVLKSPPLSATDINKLLKESGGGDHIVSDISEIGTRRTKKPDLDESKNSLDFVRRKLAQIAKINTPVATVNTSVNVSEIKIEEKSTSLTSSTSSTSLTSTGNVSPMLNERLALKYNPHPRHERLSSLSSNDGSECSFQTSAHVSTSLTTDPRLKPKSHILPIPANVLPAINMYDPRLKKMNNDSAPNMFGVRIDPRVVRQAQTQQHFTNTTQMAQQSNPFQRCPISQPYKAAEESWENNSSQQKSRQAHSPVKIDIQQHFTKTPQMAQQNNPFHRSSISQPYKAAEEFWGTNNSSQKSKQNHSPIKIPSTSTFQSYSSSEENWDSDPNQSPKNNQQTETPSVNLFGARQDPRLSSSRQLPNWSSDAKDYKNNDSNFPRNITFPRPRSGEIPVSTARENHCPLNPKELNIFQTDSPIGQNFTSFSSPQTENSYNKHHDSTTSANPPKPAYPFKAFTPSLPAATKDCHRVNSTLNDSAERKKYYESKQQTQQQQQQLQLQQQQQLFGPRTYKEHKEARGELMRREVQRREKEFLELPKKKYQEEKERKDKDLSKNKNEQQPTSKLAEEVRKNVTKGKEVAGKEKELPKESVKTVAADTTLDKMYRSQNFSAEFSKPTLSFKIPKKKTDEAKTKSTSSQPPLKDAAKKAEKKSSQKESGGKSAKESEEKHIKNDGNKKAAVGKKSHQSVDDDKSHKQQRMVVVDTPKVVKQKSDSKHYESDNGLVTVQQKSLNVRDPRQRKREPGEPSKDVIKPEVALTKKKANNEGTKIDVLSNKTKAAFAAVVPIVKSNKKVNEELNEKFKSGDFRKNALDNDSYLDLFFGSHLRPAKIIRRRSTMISIGSEPLVDKEELMKPQALMLEDIEERAKLKRKMDEENRQKARRSKQLSEMFQKTDDNCTVSTQNIITGKRSTRATINFNETKNALKVFKHMTVKDVSGSAASSNDTTPTTTTKVSKKKIITTIKCSEDESQETNASENVVVAMNDSSKKDQEATEGEEASEAIMPNKKSLDIEDNTKFEGKNLKDTNTCKTDIKGEKKKKKENSLQMKQKNQIKSKKTQPVVLVKKVNNKKLMVASAKKKLQKELSAASEAAEADPAKPSIDEDQNCAVSSTSAELPATKEEIPSTSSKAAAQQKSLKLEVDDNEPSSTGSKSSSATPTPPDEEASRHVFLNEFVQEIIKPNADKQHILSLLSQILSEDKLQIIKAVIESSNNKHYEKYEDAEEVEDAEEEENVSQLVNENDEKTKDHPHQDAENNLSEKAKEITENKQTNANDNEDKEDVSYNSGGNAGDLKAKKIQTMENGGRRTPLGRKKRNELDRLNEDIRDMFICEGVLTATGKRMCTLMQSNEKVSPKTSPPEMKTATADGASSGKKKVGRPKRQVAKPLRRSLRATKLCETSFIDDANDDEVEITTYEGLDLENSQGNVSTPLRKMPVLKPHTPIKLPEEFETETDVVVINTKAAMKRKITPKTKPCPKSKKIKKSIKIKTKEPGPDLGGTSSDTQSESDNENSVYKLNSKQLDKIKNNNIHWHNQSKYIAWCMLCSKKMPAVKGSFHYKLHHAENYISRLAPTILQKLKQGKLNHPLFGVERAAGRVTWFYKCPFCLQYFNTPLKLWLEHFQNHTAEFHYECSKCYYGYNSMAPTRKHIHKKCRGAKVVQSTVKLIKPTEIIAQVCHLCNFLQLKRANLERHYRVQHDVADKNLDTLGYTITLFDCENVELVSEDKAQQTEENIRKKIECEERIVELEDEQEVVGNKITHIDADTDATQKTPNEVITKSFEDGIIILQEIKSEWLNGQEPNSSDIPDDQAHTVNQHSEAKTTQKERNIVPNDNLEIGDESKSEVTEKTATNVTIDDGKTAENIPLTNEKIIQRNTISNISPLDSNTDTNTDVLKLNRPALQDGKEKELTEKPLTKEKEIITSQSVITNEQEKSPSTKDIDDNISQVNQEHSTPRSKQKSHEEKGEDLMINSNASGWNSSGKQNELSEKTNILSNEKNCKDLSLALLKSSSKSKQDSSDNTQVLLSKNISSKVSHCTVEKVQESKIILSVECQKEKYVLQPKNLLKETTSVPKKATNAIEAEERQGEDKSIKQLVTKESKQLENKKEKIFFKLNNASEIAKSMQKSKIEKLLKKQTAAIPDEIPLASNNSLTANSLENRVNVLYVKKIITTEAAAPAAAAAPPASSLSLSKNNKTILKPAQEAEKSNTDDYRIVNENMSCSRYLQDELLTLAAKAEEELNKEENDAILLTALDKANENVNKSTKTASPAVSFENENREIDPLQFTAGDSFLESTANDKLILESLKTLSQSNETETNDNASNSKSNKIDNTINIMGQGKKRKSVDTEACPTKKIFLTDDQAAKLSTSNALISTRFKNAGTNSPPIHILAQSIITLDPAETYEIDANPAPPPTISIAERLNQRFKMLQERANCLSKAKELKPSPIKAVNLTSNTDLVVDRKPNLKELLPANEIRTSRLKSNEVTVVISDDEDWEDIEITESAPKQTPTPAHNLQKNKNKNLFQKFALFNKCNSSKIKKIIPPLVFVPKKKMKDNKQSNSDKKMNSSSEAGGSSQPPPEERLAFKPVITNIEDLLPESPCNDPIDLVPELTPLEPLTDLNDISSILECNLSINVEERQTCIQDALDFICKEAADDDDDDEETTNTSDPGEKQQESQTKFHKNKIQHVGYSLHSQVATGGIKFYCLMAKCSFLFSSDASGLENHFLCEHSQVKWNGYCCICKTQCLEKDKPPVTIVNEIKHMVDCHVNGGVLSAAMESNSNDSSQHSNSTLVNQTTSDEKPRIKLRRMTGDCLSTSNSESPTPSAGNGALLTPTTTTSASASALTATGTATTNTLLGALLNAKQKPPTKEMPPMSEMPLTEPLLLDGKKHPSDFTNLSKEFHITSVFSDGPNVSKVVTQNIPQLQIKNVASLNAEPMPENTIPLSSKSVQDEKQDLLDPTANSQEVSTILANANTSIQPRLVGRPPDDSPGPVVVSETLPVAQEMRGDFVITQTVSTQYNDYASTSVGFNISIEVPPSVLNTPTPTAIPNTSEVSFTPADKITNNLPLLQIPAPTPQLAPPLNSQSNLEALTLDCTTSSHTNSPAEGMSPSTTSLTITSRQYKCMASGCKFTSRVPVAMSDHLRFHERRNLSSNRDYFDCAFCHYQATDVEDYMKHCDQYHIISKGINPATLLKGNICDILSKKMETNSPRRLTSSREEQNISANRRQELEKEYLEKLKITIEEIVGSTGLSDEKLYRCVIKNCPTKLNEFTFHNHILYHISTLGISSPNSFVFKCPHCPAQYHRPAGIKAHIKSHARNRYFCYMCDVTSANPGQMMKHFSEKHWHTMNMYTKELLKCNDGDDGLSSEKTFDSGYYVTYSSELSDNEVRKYGEKLILDWQRKKSGSKTHFKSSEIDLLPIQPIFQREVNCGECEYKTKVRTNMYRHLSMHKQYAQQPHVNLQSLVASVDPVNPVPCLNSSERFFDKMTNLASSSLIPSNQGGAVGTVTAGKPPYRPAHAFVSDDKRYKCGVLNCNYITLSEELFRSHLGMTHYAATMYRCPYCQEDICKRGISIDRVINHLKFHSSIVYRCEECNYAHFLKFVVERHINDKHATMIVNVVRHERTDDVGEGRITISSFKGKKYKEPSDASQQQQQVTASTSAATGTRFATNIEGAVKPATTAATTTASAAKSKSKWVCDICNHTAGALNQIQIHCQNVHGQNKQYQCKHCFFGSHQLSQILFHIDEKHPGMTREANNIFHKLLNNNEIDVADTRPLWQRNDPKRVRHIRGILMENEEESEKYRKKMGLDKVADDDDDGDDDDDDDDEEEEANAYCGDKITTTNESSLEYFLKGYEFGCFHCDYRTQIFDELASKHHKTAHCSREETSKPFIFRLVRRVCCPECRTFTGSCFDLQVHLLNVHKIQNFYAADVSVAENPEFTQTQSLMCAYCPYQCSKADQLSRHFHNPNVLHLPQDVHIKYDLQIINVLKIGAAHAYFRCTICADLLPNRVAIIHHATNRHANEDGFSFRELTNSLLYHCALCSYSATTESVLLRHMIDHYGRFKRCHFCNESQISFECYMQHCYAEHREDIRKFREIYQYKDIRKFLLQMFLLFPNGLVISKRNLLNTSVYGRENGIAEMYEEMYKISQQPPIPRLSIARLVARKSTEAYQRQDSSGLPAQQTETNLDNTNHSSSSAPPLPILKKIAKRRYSVVFTPDEHVGQSSSAPSSVAKTSKSKAKSSATLTLDPDSSSSHSSEFNAPLAHAKRRKRSRITSVSDQSSSSDSQHSGGSNKKFKKLKPPNNDSNSVEEISQSSVKYYSYYGINPEPIDLSRVYTNVAIGGINTTLPLDKFRKLFNVDCKLKVQRFDVSGIPTYKQYKHIKKACPASHKLKFT